MRWSHRKKNIFRMNNYKETHEKGTYISATPIKANREALHDWTIKTGITNPVHPDEYHTTIIYSRVSCKEAEAHDFKLPMHATISGFKVFDSKLGKCLVAALDSEDLQSVNSDITEKYGAVSDFPSYIPHITLSYGFEGELPTNPPKMDIWFTEVKVRGIDPDWKPSK